MPVGGIVAGAVVGTLIITGAIVLIVWLLTKKKNRSNSEVVEQVHENYPTGKQSINANFEMAPVQSRIDEPDQIASGRISNMVT